MDPKKQGAAWLQRTQRRLSLPSGTPRDEIFWAELQDRIKRKYDNMVMVCGQRGEGKSTLARKVARRLFPAFNVAEHCCFSIQEVMQVSEGLRPGSVVIWDEPIEGAMKRAHATKRNRMMEEFFTISRDRRLTTLILHMHKDKFDGALRDYATHWLQKNGRPTYTAHVKAKPNAYRQTDHFWIPLFRQKTTADSVEEEAAYEQKKNLARRSIAARYADADAGGQDFSGFEKAALQVAGRD